MQEKEYEIISIPISNGTEKEFVIIDTFTAEEKNYVAVSLVEEDQIQDGVYIYRCTEAEDGDVVVETIYTPAEYKRAVRVYETLH